MLQILGTDKGDYVDSFTNSLQRTDPKLAFRSLEKQDSSIRSIPTHFNSSISLGQLLYIFPTVHVLLIQDNIISIHVHFLKSVTIELNFCILWTYIKKQCVQKHIFQRVNNYTMMDDRLLNMMSTQTFIKHSITFQCFSPRDKFGQIFIIPFLPLSFWIIRVMGMY